MELKKFKCVLCGTELKEIWDLDNNYRDHSRRRSNNVWYECHVCGCQATQWSPEWNIRFDTGSVRIRHEYEGVQ